VENKTKIFMAVLGVLLVVASSGATYLLQPTGDTSRCYGGWEFNADGEHEGMYSCTTSNDVRFEYCAAVYDSKSGRTDFYCDVAVPVLVEQSKSDDLVSREGYICTVKGCEILVLYDEKTK
jgi:hypothetical protein